MTKTKLLGKMCYAVCLFCTLSVRQLPADFVIDNFSTPTSEATSNLQASVGQTVTGSGLLDGRREFNITASFNIQTVTLNIASGTLVHVVTPNAPSPLGTMMLKYVDTSPSETLPLPSGNLLIENVAANAPWSLLITMKGTNLPAGTTYAPSIAAGFNGNLLIPLNLFPGSSNLGNVTEIQFDFTNTTGGQLSLGQLSVTSVPEPSAILLGLFTCLGPLALRRHKKA